MLGELERLLFCSQIDQANAASLKNPLCWRRRPPVDATFVGGPPVVICGKARPIDDDEILVVPLKKIARSLVLSTLNRTSQPDLRYARKGNELEALRRCVARFPANHLSGFARCMRSSFSLKKKARSYTM